MSDKILVTGATGFIGSAVVRSLLRDGHAVRVLARSSSPRHHLTGLEVEECVGDLLHPESLFQALRGCRYLFHVAAHYKLFNRPADLPYRINVEGTRNLLREAHRIGIEKIVYTSSVSTIGICPQRGLGNEETPLDEASVVGYYKRSKILAEKEVMRWVQEHALPVTIVNPAAPIGVGDIKPTPTGRMVLEYLRGRMVGYLDTGLNVIDVADVAQGHLLALDKGQVGRRYILGHRNMSLQEIFQVLAQISGIRAPRWKIPYPVALAGGWAEQTLARWTGRDPLASVDAIRMSRKKMYFDSTRAVRELGLVQGSVVKAFEKAVQWFYDHGYVPSRAQRRMAYEAASIR